MKTFQIPKAKSITLDSAISSFIKEIKKDTEFRESLKYLKEKKEQLERFIEEGKSPISEPKNQLVIMRKWNSYTPILPPAHEEYLNKGGGYFLRIEDVGIVIDPGFNFVENYLKAGFKLDDIDHIFISHAHNDHAVELEGIFSLLFKRNKKSSVPKKIKLYLNVGAFKKYSGYFDLSNPSERDYLDDIVLLNKHQCILINDTIQVFTTQAKHHEMITKKYALGFTFIININDTLSRTIKFTCDTGWSSSLEEINKKEGEKFKIEKIDILVAHIGSIKESEMKYKLKYSLDENEKLGILYDHHLGIIGCAASLHYWKPELCLISEFGEELDGVRKTISEYLRDKMKTKVIATDLNFRVDINTLDIMCFKTRKYYPYENIKIEYMNGQIYPLNQSKLSATEKAELNNFLGKTIKIYEELDQKSKRSKKSGKKRPKK